MPPPIRFRDPVYILDILRTAFGINPSLNLCFKPVGTNRFGRRAEATIVPIRNSSRFGPRACLLEEPKQRLDALQGFEQLREASGAAVESQVSTARGGELWTNE